MNTKILIVEDEGLIALDLKKKLAHVGYDVPMIADNSADALQYVELFQPALVLMDIRLRGEPDGIATAEEIRRRFEIPVMFVTSHADRETLERAKLTEPFGYIVKPFHSVDFRAQIEMALWKHKMEAKVRASEAWLAAIFRNVADALIATDRDGNIASMNGPAADLTGWDTLEAQGRPLLEVFQVFEELTHQPVVHPLDALYQGREISTTPRSFILENRDGSTRTVVEAHLSANHDHDTVLGVIIVFRDITARRAAERRERHARKMQSLSLMAAGLGRDLAESQDRIDDSLERLISDAPDHLLGHFLDFHKCFARQYSIVQQLIALGRRDEPRAVSLDINGALGELHSELAKALGTQRSLQLKLDPTLPRVKADPEALRESLLTLIVSARRAMPRGGEVEISTTRVQTEAGEDGALVAFADAGQGIPHQAEEYVFDPYFPARPGVKNPGFSLALVQQFVALSGGTITMENASGKGIRYLMLFPPVNDAPVAALFDDPTFISKVVQ